MVRPKAPIQLPLAVAAEVGDALAGRDLGDGRTAVGAGLAVPVSLVQEHDAPEPVSWPPANELPTRLAGPLGWRYPLNSSVAVWKSILAPPTISI